MGVLASLGNSLGATILGFLAENQPALLTEALNQERAHIPPRLPTNVGSNGHVMRHPGVRLKAKAVRYVVPNPVKDRRTGEYRLREPIPVFEGRDARTQAKLDDEGRRFRKRPGYFKAGVVRKESRLLTLREAAAA